MIDFCDPNVKIDFRRPSALAGSCALCPERAQVFLVVQRDGKMRNTAKLCTTCRHRIIATRSSRRGDVHGITKNVKDFRVNADSGMSGGQALREPNGPRPAFVSARPRAICEKGKVMKYAALLVTLSLFGCRVQDTPLVPEAKHFDLNNSTEFRGTTHRLEHFRYSGITVEINAPPEHETRRIATRQDFLDGPTANTPDCSARRTKDCWQKEANNVRY